MLSSFAIYDDRGRENVVFTTPVTNDDLENMEGLRFCPMTFQENVPKALELRTTIVGHRVFTAAVDSQSLSGSTYDWRKEGRALVKNWQPYDLPEDIEKKLLKLMAYFGLNFLPLIFTTKPVGQGTGLGLSISYQIVVQKHSGLLRCESELGKGTEFWIEIPLRQVAIAVDHNTLKLPTDLQGSII